MFSATIFKCQPATVHGGHSWITWFCILFSLYMFSHVEWHRTKPFSFASILCYRGGLKGWLMLAGRFVEMCSISSTGRKVCGERNLIYHHAAAYFPRLALARTYSVHSRWAGEKGERQKGLNVAAMCNQYCSVCIGTLVRQRTTRLLYGWHSLCP